MNVSATALVVGTFCATVGCRARPEHTALAQSVPASSDVESRRVWSGTDFNFYASAPSPDGRYVTEVDWSTGNLAVRDLATGQLRPITNKESWATSGDYAEVSMFSTDGRQIAYSWYEDDINDYQLRLIDFVFDGSGVPKGTNPRVIYSAPPLVPYWVFGWSPDGEILTGIYRPDKTTALAFISTETGVLRVLKSFDWRDPGAALSSNGRFIAYDYPPRHDSQDRDIYLITSDGTRDVELVAGPGNDIVMGWVPGDRALLFYSDRSGSPSVWQLPIANGEPCGPAILVQEDVWHMEPLGFSSDAFYYGVEVETPAYRIAPIDLKTGRIQQGSAPLHDAYGRTIRGMDWSPDGLHLVHGLGRPGRRGLGIVIRTAGGEAIREWTFDLEMRLWQMRWAPDGKSVVFPAFDNRGRLAFYRINLDTGTLSIIRRFEHPDEFRGPFALSPDGRYLYYPRSVVNPEEGTDERVIELVAHDLLSHQERPIHHVFTPGRLEVSPDGAWLAHYERGARSPDKLGLQLIPANGGTARMLFEVTEKDTGIDGIAGWTPDGQSIVFVLSRRRSSNPLSDVELELWQVSAHSSEPARMITRLAPETWGSGFGAYNRAGLRLHPDGRSVLYRSGRLRGEIWVMGGLGTPATRRGVGR